MIFQIGYWYEMICSDESVITFQFLGGSDNYLKFVDCDGIEFNQFPLFKSVTELGQERPC